MTQVIEAREAPPLETVGGPKRPGLLGRTLSLLRTILIEFLVFAVTAELFCLVYINVTNWPGSKPSYKLSYNLFWADLNPVFGVWHRPNGKFIHKSGCFTVEYTTNGYGARDVERSLHSSAPRTIVLGDSFIEAMGLPDQERLTNLLEKRTGREYLNFGTGGNFGPLQYALLYKSLASKFDHKLVVVGVLPDNDFHDMSLEYWKAHGAGDRYRPYYADDFSIFYTGKFDPHGGETVWDHAEAAMRAYLASYHVGEYIHARLYWRTLEPYSGYNDWNDVDLARLKHALEDIQTTAAAHGAKLAVLLIPGTHDFEQLHAAHVNRLGPVMESWGKSVGIPVKDLLPEMEARAGAGYRSLFLTCDHHWSARGNQVAADILQPWLEEQEKSQTSKTGSSGAPH